jgi:lipoprotein-anchoring transpeptidase ErfK/SrfK
LTRYVESKSATSARISPVAPSVRSALLAGGALVCVTGALMSGLAGPAAAAMPGYYYPDQGVSPYYDPYYSPNPILRPNPIVRPSPVVRPNPRPDVDSGSRPSPKPNLREPAKDFGAVPKGPLQIVVSIANQHVTLYSNGAQVAQAPVSTGVPGRPTPTGVFSIIQKDRFHHSNLYSNAPMPFMERITWSGVALHEGPLPGYPASHGCIRLTHDFAERLWQVARLGVRVIVARTDVVPVDIAHPRLFAPKPKPAEPPVASDNPDKHAELAPPVHLVEAVTVRSDTAVEHAAPAAAPTTPDALRGSTAVSPTPVGTTATVPAPQAGEAAKPTFPDPPKSAADAVDPAKSTPMPAPLRSQMVGQPVHHTGTVAVFISRKEKKIFVRQGFASLFDMPIEIEQPEQPLGTHVFTALGFTDNGAHMRWNVMTMPAELPRQQIASKIGSKANPDARPATAYLPQTPAQVLDRIQIPQEAADRIGEILSPGASLVISDKGLGEETGEGTDFIVVTR